MKKLFVLFAAAMLTASASAQGTAVTSSKFGDVSLLIPRRKMVTTVSSSHWLLSSVFASVRT